VTVAQPVKARINLLFVNCFKCVDQPPEAWDKVLMELDSQSGNLYIAVNNTRRQHLFKNLPTDRALYPCIMAVNTGQAHFEILDAQRY
jgi:predicted DCC family thiol-disulfide oxidoreductase YuxK